MKTNIRKGKVTVMITIGLACFVLALVMSMQFKIVNQTDITSIENMREAELRTELANWKSRYEEVETEYQDIEAKVKEYKDTKQSNEETEKIIDAELEQVDLILGKTDVQGEGIEITLKENATDEMGKINGDDLLLLVNALKLAGAEAISINDERIVNMSDIVFINYSFIRTNGQRILAPYVIKAIGEPAYLESALIGPGGTADDLKKLGHDVSIEKVNRLEINKYNDEMNTRYMK